MEERKIEQQIENKRRDQMNVPLWEKLNLTVKEAAIYSGVGEHTIRELLEDTNTNFAFRIGNKWMINRSLFTQFFIDACQNRQNSL